MYSYVRENIHNSRETESKFGKTKTKKIPLRWYISIQEKYELRVTELQNFSKKIKNNKENTTFGTCDVSYDNIPKIRTTQLGNSFRVFL